MLRADKAQLSIGECTTLRWDVENVKEVWLNSGSGENPVVGHDTLDICPDETFTYTLRVVNKDNSMQRYTFAIAVTGCGADPVVALFRGQRHRSQSRHQSDRRVGRLLRSIGVHQNRQWRQKLPAVGRDSAEFQLNETTTFRLIIVAKDNKRNQRHHDQSRAMNLTAAPTCGIVAPLAMIETGKRDREAHTEHRERRAQVKASPPSSLNDTLEQADRKIHVPSHL